MDERMAPWGKGVFAWKGGVRAESGHGRGAVLHEYLGAYRGYVAQRVVDQRACEGPWGCPSVREGAAEGPGFGSSPSARARRRGW